MDALKGDLGLILNADEAQKVATETISVIEQNPRALFETETLIEWMEDRFSLDLDSVIQQAVNIQAMHKPQTFEEMTFDAKDVHDISDFVIKRVHRETVSKAESSSLEQKVADLQRELDFVNEEVAFMQQQIGYLTQSKMENVLSCNQQIDEMRAILSKYAQICGNGND